MLKTSYKVIDFYGIHYKKNTKNIKTEKFISKTEKTEGSDVCIVVNVLCIDVVLQKNTRR